MKLVGSKAPERLGAAGLRPAALLALAAAASLLLSTPAACDDAAASDGAAPSLVRARLERPGAVAGHHLRRRDLVLEFYERRDFAPAWSGSDRALQNSSELMDGIQRSESHGLSPAWYRAEAIEDLLGRAERADEGPLKEGLRADVDILMTDAFFHLAGHLDSGVENPYHSAANQRKPASDTDLVALLIEAHGDLGVGRALEGAAPDDEQYRRLEIALKRMREIAAVSSWPRVPPSRARKIDPGQRDPTVPAVRMRLAAESFLKPALKTAAPSRKQIAEELLSPIVRETADPELYDEELVVAVMDFQRKYGLDPDGVIGHRTLHMMNRDPSWFVCQIKINMDRRRGLRRLLSADRYAAVNIPEFSLTVYEEGRPVNSMKAIVGMLSRKSPLMSDMMKFIVFSPKWHVPRSIAVKDKLPKIRKDSSYVRRHGLRLYAVGDTGMEEVKPESVDWDSVSERDFPFRMVQGTGDANALGRVKFMFPNRHDVYLHDTPTKYLFDRDQRTFSSGCIRIADPIWFAEYLLGDKERWDRERIKGAMRLASPLTVHLTEPVPIHIFYFTAWGDERGEPVLRHDVYGFDEESAKVFCADSR